MSTKRSRANFEDRRHLYDAIAGHLTALTDNQLAAVLERSGSWSANSHGNQPGVIDVEGAKVFVKKIALTDVERITANRGSTANLFDLPLFYQYGVGSAGFGAWRELKAQLCASAWTLSGECPYFPVVYHWRVLPRTSPPLSVKQRDRLDRAVEYWDHSRAIRDRLEAIFAATASIAVFTEYVPETMREWLSNKWSGDCALDAAIETAILRFDEQLRDAAAFMNDRGMLHFDLNGSNVLTDGEQVYVADFGLAICADFDLSPVERAFFRNHRLYDRCYVDWFLVEWLTREQEPHRVLTPALRALIDRGAPIAKIMRSFFNTLRDRSKTVPYPAAQLDAALAGQPSRSA